MEFFDEIALALDFWGDISNITDIFVETGLFNFFPAHLLDRGSEEEEFEFVHHHDFGDFDHDFVKGDIVKVRLFLTVLTEFPQQAMRVVGELAGDILLVSFSIPLLDVDLGFSSDARDGRSAHCDQYKGISG